LILLSLSHLTVPLPIPSCNPHTTEANNRNAYDLALSLYKTQMDAAAGADKPYMKEADLQGVHDALYIAAFQQFDEIATMGTICCDSDVFLLRPLRQLLPLCCYFLSIGSPS
jgi:hypothetical protein